MTNEQTIAQINKDLEKAVLNVTEWATDMLIKDIDKYVYDWGDRMKMQAFIHQGQLSEYWKGGTRGTPTGQFRRSITYERMHADMRDFVGYMIFSDPNKMEFDARTHLHGNSKGRDYRAVLMERLNEMKDDYIPNPTPDDDNPDREPTIRWWKRGVTGNNDRYHFFDRYLDELGNEIYDRFEMELRKVGMKVVDKKITNRRETNWDF